MHPSQYNQLHAFGTGASTNSAHSSPLKRAPPAAVSPLASPMESRRLFAPSASAKPSVSSTTDHSMLNAIQLGYTLAGPQPAKLLIDPQTGQQYFVPTTPQPMSYFAAPAPLFYHNQFYSAPAPTANTTQAHSGFVFANQPTTTLWSPQQLNTANPTHCQRQRALSPSAVSTAPTHCSGADNQHQTQNFTAYHVEVPLSSVGSVCEETEFVQQQQHVQHAQQSFQRQHQIRQSTESRGSIRSSGESNRHETLANQRDPISIDRFSPSHPSPSHTQNQSLPSRQLLQLQSDHHSTGGSSSESTSGFASGRDRLRAEEVSEGRSPPQSPLLQKEKILFPPVQSEETNICRADSPKSPLLSRPLPQRMKAIRMDIDLNRSVSPPEREQQVSLRSATVLRTAPPTAFTISFNNSPSVPDLPPHPHESVGGSSEFSLQEAARQAPSGRRLMASRRSVPPRPILEKGERTGGTESGSEAGDPKQWLFRKMMLGRDQRPRDTTEEGEGSEEGSADDADDMVSETGTYVVESKKMGQSRQTMSNVSPRGCRSGNSVPPSTCSPFSASNSSSSRTPSPNAASAVKRSLMSDLRRLREQKKNSIVPPKAIAARVPMSHQIPAGQSRPCRQSISSSNSAKRTENTLFSRSDGGRFSMRGTHNQPTKGQLKAAVNTTKGALQQQSPEMMAWLRRKEYDPRKAAAAADQCQREAQQRQQQESFIACRSFSTSANVKSPFARWRQSRRAQLAMADQRSNRSHDDLSRLGESLDDESFGVVADSCSNSLQRTVDELTQKCHKSIELLKLCNQSGLSSSVEQLLEKVVEGSAGEDEGRFTTADSDGKANSENISDRLERLSSAFDAIQKYLEEQTLMSSSRASLAALTGGKMATGDDGVKKQMPENKYQ